MSMVAAVMRGTPFGEGYLDGLYGRPNETANHGTERDRAKYSDGYRIGVEERRAGALERDVDA